MRGWIYGVKVTKPGTLTKKTSQEHVTSKEVADICLSCEKSSCKKGTCDKLRAELKRLSEN